MKTNRNGKAPKKALMLGEFIAGIYDACGKRKAKGVVRLAIKAHWVEYRERNSLVLS